MMVVHAFIFTNLNNTASLIKQPNLVLTLLWLGEVDPKGYIRGFPASYCEIQSLEDTGPFHVSRKITKMFLRSRTINGFSFRFCYHYLWNLGINYLKALTHSATFLLTRCNLFRATSHRASGPLIHP